MQYGEIKKTCLMQYVKAGQNVNQDMVNGFPKMLILKSSSDTEHCPFQQPALENSQDLSAIPTVRKKVLFFFALITLLNYHSKTALGFKHKTNAASIHEF